MANTASGTAQWPGRNDLSASVRLSFLGPDEEHVALLVDLRRFASLRRWDDLLDKGVAGVFSLASEEAKLLALSFHAEEFTPARAEAWLAERGFKPLLFLPNSGRLPSASFDPPLATRLGRATSGNSPTVDGDRGFPPDSMTSTRKGAKSCTDTITKPKRRPTLRQPSRRAK
jgi:hypothetical protein